MIAGNWKMNTTVSEAIELVSEMRQGLDEIDNVDKVICPPFISLAAVKELIKGSSIKLGAQNIYFEEKGAYTGEISPLMLADLCEFVIIGHSERRQYFNETGDIINKKIQAALRVGLKPILCIGESFEENEAGRTEEVVTEQLMASSARIYYLSGLVIAYEPVWAIGRCPCRRSQSESSRVLEYREANLRNQRSFIKGSLTGVDASSNEGVLEGLRPSRNHLPLPLDKGKGIKGIGF